MKESLIHRIKNADNDTLQRVELAIEDPKITERLDKLFSLRGVPTSGASFNYFRHEVFPKLDGDLNLRLNQVTKMTQGKYFDIDLLLKNGNKGVVSIFDYTSVISSEAKKRMLSYIANDWSSHAVGRGEYYVHLLTANSRKGESHDILIDNKRVEIKSNRSRFSSSGCITDLRVVISDMTKYLRFVAPDFEDVFEKFNSKTFVGVYKRLFPDDQSMVDFLVKFTITLYVNIDDRIARTVIDELYDGSFASVKLCLSMLEFKNYQDHVMFDHIILLDYETGDCVVLNGFEDVQRFQHNLSLNVAYNFEHNRGNSISWNICR